MLPILYHSIVLVRSSHLKSLTIVLRNKPHLRGLVKVLGVGRTWGDRDYIGRAREDKPHIQEIYRHCTNLTVMDFDHHGNIWSLGEEANRGRKLEYLVIGTELLRDHAYLYKTLSSFDHLRFIAFDLTRASAIPISQAPRLTLPRLEVLSICTNHTFNEEVDRYFGEAELPNLHTLQLTLKIFSSNMQINELDRYQAIWRCHGARIKTLKIDDQTGRGLFTIPPSSVKLNRHLINLQQLVVNGQIWRTFLMELGMCSSITTLEISQTKATNTYFERLLSEDVCKWFDNLQWLRISVAPDLYGQELMYGYDLDNLERVIEQYRAAIKVRGVRGVKIISEIRRIGSKKPRNSIGL
jgi:hypothetical protein